MTACQQRNVSQHAQIASQDLALAPAIDNGKCRAAWCACNDDSAITPCHRQQWQIFQSSIAQPRAIIAGFDPDPRQRNRHIARIKKAVVHG